MKLFSSFNSLDSSLPFISFVVVVVVLTAIKEDIQEDKGYVGHMLSTS